MRCNSAGRYCTNLVMKSCKSGSDTAWKSSKATKTGSDNPFRSRIRLSARRCGLGSCGCRNTTYRCCTYTTSALPYLTAGSRSACPTALSGQEASLLSDAFRGCGRCPPSPCRTFKCGATTDDMGSQARGRCRHTTMGAAVRRTCSLPIWCRAGLRSILLERFCVQVLGSPWLEVLAPQRGLLRAELASQLD